MDDSFTDNERTTQSLPDSAAWYVPTAAAGSLQLSNHALTLVANDHDRSLTAYFPSVTLGIGDTLTFTVNFAFSRTAPSIPDGFRTMVAYTNGTAPRRTDGTVTGQYQGYGAFTNPGSASGTLRNRKRNGPAASRSTASLLEITDGATDVVWDTFGSARTAASRALQAVATNSCTISIQRTGPDSATVTTTFTGGSPSTTTTLVEVDASAAFFTFDTVALAAADTAAAGDFSLSRALLTVERTTARISNLSILTTLSSSSDNFVMGYVVSGADATHPKPLVIRAVGPSLSAFLANTVDDPRLETYAGATKTGENDNWGGSISLSNAMTAVGAFPYASTTSKDAAVSSAITTRDNSVKVSATGPGALIAEIYDATPADSYTESTPRLANVSVRKQIGTGLTVGFVIGGTGSRQVLIRAIGPGLAAFGVPGTIADPQLRLNRSGAVIAANDNWGGTPSLSAAFNAVGAFGLTASSKDAALLITLTPGDYSVEVTSTDTNSGEGLVEVYEVR